MNWLYTISTTELAIIAIFCILYIAYILRVMNTSFKLGVGFEKVFIKAILRFIVFALLIVALLGPSFGESKREVKSVGKDIFLLVDLSQSMNASDIQPTRLEKLKFELKNIIESFSSDRLGIIIFSSEAFMQSPLTYDQNALNLFVETLHTNLVPNAGTDFGPPLRMALEKLNEDESPLTSQKSKIILLISDGEDFGESTEDIANDIADQDIKLFTLGIGTERGSKILTRNGYKKDRNGNDVVTKLDSRSLKNLANNTDGQYFEINETNNDINRLINKINTIEGELRDTKQVDVSANRYYYFLMAALLLLFIDIITNVKVIRI
ncbi:vWA domain-containing protein [Fulvivirga lutea]|uniref:VWA domain-containing protein n=1 Tax=Fulvivirga lutea TaxID=2810512 RepID=A0A974WJ30_9BACT|nr:VWA domain-containing protein [Fulvivirga lutea]QSE96258.1 VWA domain-containing protein [Fulvivirga lutea]